MGGDITRDTFDPRKNYTAVRMQQGRVQLDADWNEQADILERRLQAGFLDTLGACAVAAETPDAFRVRYDDGVLTIGLGRLYVDGLPAENHGDFSDPAQTAFDPVLGELRGAGPTDVARQPYLATPDPLPAAGTAAIAYLDVWERDVTAAMEPSLVEPAVGADTAGRSQAVWQVRLLPVTDSHLARARLESSPEWQTLTAPPNGRLSTAITGDADAAGGGNHLYRVQIHGSGGPGMASFKWSRDNASFSSAVLGLSADRSQVQLATSRVDAVRLFSPDDWVEVIDDHRELAGAPGQLAKVRAADHVTATLTLSPALDADFDPNDASRHLRVIRWDQKGPVSAPDGTRLGDVDTWKGAIPIPTGGGAVVLEDGVAVAFSVAGRPARRAHGAGRARVLVEEEIIALEDEIEIIEVEVTTPARRQARSHRARAAQPADAFRTGDYWQVATRTGGYRDELVEAPPRGIHHHFCPLAIVAPPRVVDTRVLPSHERRQDDCGCGCSVCVTPRSHAEGSLTVQSAIDRVRDEGGVVCLEAGLYRLDQPLDVTSAESLTLRGQGWSTVLLYTGDEPAIAISTAVGVRLEELTVAAGSRTTKAASSEAFATLASQAPANAKSLLTTIEKALARQSGPAGAVVAVRDSMAVSIRGCCLIQLGWDAGSPPAVRLGGTLLGTEVAGSLVVGGIGVGNVTPTDAAQVFEVDYVRDALAKDGPWDPLVATGIRVVDNFIWCAHKGVSFEGFTVHIDDNRVAGNRIGLCRDGGILVTGQAVAGDQNRPEAGAFLIEGNTLSVTGDGIVAGLDNARVIGNAVAAFGQVDFAERGPGDTTQVSSPGKVGQAGDGIVLAPGLALTLTGCVVEGNRVNSTAGHGIHVRADVDRVLIAGNLVEGVGGYGIVKATGLKQGSLTVQDNRVWNVVARPYVAQGKSAAGGAPGVAGIALHQLGRAVVSRNDVRGVMAEDGGTADRDGIQLGQCASISIAGNYIDTGGTLSTPAGGAGIHIVDQAFEDVDVVDNQVRQFREYGDQGAAGKPYGLALLISEWQLKGTAGEPNDVTGLATAKADQEAYEANAPSRDLQQRNGTVSVRGNLLEVDGPIPIAAAAITTGGPCMFTDNRCSSVQPPQGAGIVEIDASAVIVNSNFVIGPTDVTAILVQLPVPEIDQVYVVTSNLTSGPILINNTRLSDASNLNRTDLV